MLRTNLIKEIESTGILQGWQKADDDAYLAHDFHFGNPRSAT